MKMHIAALGLALAVTGAFFAPMGTVKASAAAEPAKTADVYIVAGQSNAVGNSLLSQKVKGQEDENYTYEKMLIEADARNKNGYENVLYYGATDIYVSAAEIPNPDIVPVKFGQGNSSTRIGPELGMAQILSKTATEDHPAVIFKFAAGGTTIGDNKGYYQNGLTKEFGNWASPSVIARWEAEGQKAYSGNGVMYNRLMQLFDNGIAKLKAMGYNPVLKGFAWMQGESDADEEDLAKVYEQNLTDVVNDIRNAIAQKTGIAADANRPFVIGKVCPTYNLNYGTTTQGVRKIRAAQDKVANTLSYCYTVETEDLPLVDVKLHQIVGADQCHFNAGDMYELGKRFATALLDNTAAHSFSVTSGEGGTAQRNVHTNGATLEIPYEAVEGKTVEKVVLNDKEILEFTNENGVISFTLPEDVGEFNEISITFTDIPAASFPIWAIVVIVVGAVLSGVGVGLVCYFTGKKKKKSTAANCGEKD